MSTQVSDRPRRITEWLDINYTNKATKDSYYTALKNWVKCFYGEEYISKFIGKQFGMDEERVKRDVEKRINEIEVGVQKYFNELNNRDFLNDFKKFIHWQKNEGYSNLTIRHSCSSVKLYFARQKDAKCKIDDDDWAQIKRTLLPKSSRASTQDRILTKEQLKIILQHCNIHFKSMLLFLLSTGARIGETCKLQMEDLHLYNDPPWVDIKNEYTKGKVGGRMMWFSLEARDAIIEWHKIRKSREKGGLWGKYSDNLVFNYKETTFSKKWNSILAKADEGQDPPVLARRDQSTKNKVHVYHIHTLRKFFSTKMRQAGVPTDTVHAWMGHQAYLAAAYDRQSGEDLSEVYKEHINVVTIHEIGLDEKTRAEAKEAIERADKLAKQVTVDGVYIDMVGEQLGAFAGLSEEVIGALSGKEKWNLIINKAAQLNAKAALSSEEVETALKQMLVA